VAELRWDLPFRMKIKALMHIRKGESPSSAILALLDLIFRYLVFSIQNDG